MVPENLKIQPSAMIDVFSWVLALLEAMEWEPSVSTSSENWAEAKTLGLAYGTEIDDNAAMSSTLWEQRADRALDETRKRGVVDESAISRIVARIDTAADNDFAGGANDYYAIFMPEVHQRFRNLEQTDTIELISLIEDLRSDYARHVARRSAPPSTKHLEWPGVHQAGIKASEWIKEHYRDEIADGTFRLSDIRKDPNTGRESQLYKALMGEARRYNVEPGDLVPQNISVHNRRREVLARLVGTTADDPHVGEFFSIARTSRTTSPPLKQR